MTEIETKTEENKLRAVGTSHLDWKYTVLVLGKDNIEDLETLDNRRMLRNSNVNKLRRLLEKGQHFETPFVCNKAKNKFRLLDGNHRHEAIKRFLENYPGRRVEVAICYYEGLDEEEEKLIYTLWNLGTKQTTNDFVKQYWDEIPIATLLNSPSFPWNVGPYPTPNGLEFKQIVGPYLIRNSTEVVYRSSASDFIEKSKQLGNADFGVLKEFAKEYTEVFGKPEKINVMYKPLNFASMMKIWLKNRELVTPEKMRKRMARARGCERAMFWSTQSNNANNSEQCHKDLLVVTNKGTSKEIFV